MIKWYWIPLISLLLSIALSPLIGVKSFVILLAGVFIEALKVYIEHKKPEKFENKDEKLPNIRYGISSELPGRKKFDFIKDWKVWFWIENHDNKKYLVYVSINFIIDDKHYIMSIDKTYYSGGKPFNLNARRAVIAPGLPIPPQVKKAALKKKKIEIRIDCEVKDEKNKSIEKRLSEGYVYQYNTNYWYFEP